METALSEALRLIRQELEAIRGLLEWQKADTLAERAVEQERMAAYIAEQEAMVLRVTEKAKQDAFAAAERDREKWKQEQLELGRQLRKEDCEAHNCAVAAKEDKKEPNG